MAREYETFGSEGAPARKNATPATTIFGVLFLVACAGGVGYVSGRGALGEMTTNSALSMSVSDAEAAAKADFGAVTVETMQAEATIEKYGVRLSEQHEANDTPGSGLSSAVDPREPLAIVNDPTWGTEITYNGMACSLGDGDGVGRCGGATCQGGDGLSRTNVCKWAGLQVGTSGAESQSKDAWRKGSRTGCFITHNGPTGWGGGGSPANDVTRNGITFRVIVGAPFGDNPNRREIVCGPPIPVDCVLGAAVGASDCTGACGTLSQSVAKPAIGTGNCSPGSYTCQVGDGVCTGLNMPAAQCAPLPGFMVTSSSSSVRLSEANGATAATAAGGFGNIIKETDTAEATMITFGKRLSETAAAPAQIVASNFAMTYKDAQNQNWGFYGTAKGTYDSLAKALTGCQAVHPKGRILGGWFQTTAGQWSSQSFGDPYTCSDQVYNPTYSGANADEWWNGMGSATKCALGKKSDPPTWQCYPELNAMAMTNSYSSASCTAPALWWSGYSWSNTAEVVACAVHIAEPSAPPQGQWVSTPAKCAALKTDGCFEPGSSASSVTGFVNKDGTVTCSTGAGGCAEKDKPVPQSCAAAQVCGEWRGQNNNRGVLSVYKCYVDGVFQKPKYCNANTKPELP